jgi:hypothetical protein
LELVSRVVVVLRGAGGLREGVGRVKLMVLGRKLHGLVSFRPVSCRIQDEKCGVGEARHPRYHRLRTASMPRYLNELHKPNGSPMIALLSAYCGGQVLLTG